MGSITAAAAVLLALPAVAAGRVPGLGEVVGGATETAQSIPPAPVAPGLAGPPAQLQAPAPKRPAAAAVAPAPGASAPAASRQSAAVASPQTASSSGNASARGASKAGPAAEDDGGVRAPRTSDAPARTSQNESAGESAGSDVASQAADLPDDAGPATLPFTGLQLALIAMAGVAALAAGLTLRVAARTAKR